MDRAIEQRSEESIRRFIQELAASSLWEDPGFKDDFIHQLAKDWELDSEQVWEWAEEAWEEVWLKKMAAFRLAMASNA
jgi:hypothetical protein